MKKILLLLICAVFWSVCMTQENRESLVHSHNDYNQSVPFWTAYHAGASSIEADIFLKDGIHFVTHAEEEIIRDRTLNKLYLDPMKSLISQGLGPGKPLQLLIDIKSEPYATIDALIALLDDYPEVVKHPTVQIVISGARPQACEYKNYPSYIFFDHQSRELEEACWASEKIGLISFSFTDYSTWDGFSPLPISDREIIKTLVGEAHGKGKKFRFWATPDTPDCWKELSSLGVDYINTDMPKSCVDYLTRH